MENFIKLKKLGTGNFSSVYKVLRKEDNSIYALKEINLLNLTEKEKTNAVNEVRLLASIKSNYIIGYKQAFVVQNCHFLCLILEYADGGDLETYLKGLQPSKFDGIRKTQITEKLFWNISLSILKGLYTLHSHNIIHRDIKTANIFISKGIYKLGDLNVSSLSKGTLLKTQTGTPYYASPEVWRHEPYNEKSDIWSLGCLLYEIISGSPPFQAKTMEMLFEKIQKGSYNRLNSSENVNRLINMCLKVFPEKRPSAKRILEFEFISKESQKFGISSSADNDEFNLLATIEIPKNIQKLKERLPSPNYEKNKSVPARRPHTSNSNSNSLKNFSMKSAMMKNNSEVLKKEPSKVLNLKKNIFPSKPRPFSTNSHSLTNRKENNNSLLSSKINLKLFKNIKPFFQNHDNVRIKSANPCSNNIENSKDIVNSNSLVLKKPRLPILSNNIRESMSKLEISPELKSKILAGRTNIFSVEGDFRFLKRPFSENPNTKRQINAFSSKKLRPLKLSKEKIDLLITRIHSKEK